MANTFTTNLGLPVPARSDRGWNVPLASWANSLDATVAVGGLGCKSGAPDASGNPTGLAVKVAPGSFAKGDGTVGSLATVATVSVPASATTYLWVTEAGAVNTGTGWPTVNYTPVAVVTAGATDVTAIADARLPYRVVRASLIADAGQAALTDSSGGSTAAFVVAALTAPAALTDSTGGTASGTLAAISDAPTANAIASLNAKLNAVEALFATQNSNNARVVRLLNLIQAALVTLKIIKGSA